MENKNIIPSPDFFRDLVHEMRNPLNSIVGYCQLLSSTRLGNTQQTYVNNMSACCLQLVGLINDILDFSKLTAGKMVVNNECFSIKEITDEVNSAISARILEKKQRLKYILSPDLPEYIISDKKKIIQILINLLTNASKFTEADGRILVNISVKSQDQLEISVEDNGIGISEEDQKKLFTPFNQLNLQSASGTGLGLVISKKLVEILNGNLVVDSEAGKGSIFTFTVSYKPYENFLKIIDNNKHVLVNKTILIVDGNSDSRLDLSETLFEYDMHPIFCSTHKEAVKFLSRKKNNFCAAIIDLGNNKLSTALAKNLKEINLELPIIILSGVNEVIHTSFDNFIDAVVNKPAHKIKLLDTLIRTLQKTDISQFELNPSVSQIKSVDKIKLLVVEDAKYNLEMLVKMLDTIGYKNITTAIDGEIAISLLQDNVYDILLVDLKMPKKDGFDVVKYIQAKNINLKIAVLSGSASDEDKIKCKELGIKYFLPKPFNMSHLRVVLNRMTFGTGVGGII